MTNKPENYARAAAVCYLAISALFFWGSGLLAAATGWDDLFRLVGQGGLAAVTVVFLIVQGPATLLLALGAWRVLSLRMRQQRYLLSVCLVLSGIFVVWDIGIMLENYFTFPDFPPSATRVASDLETALVYVGAGWLLARAVRMTAKVASPSTIKP